MRVVHFDKKSGELKVIPQSLEDLWHLERVLEQGDLVKGKSLRRFKLDEGDSGEKKAVNIELEAKKIEFHKHANILRVMGVIKAGTPEEYVQIGSHHTLDLEIDGRIAIQKDWKEYQLNRLRKAQQETKRPLVGIVAMDERKATFATLRGYGVEFEFEINNEARKGEEKHEEKQRGYFGEVMKVISGMKVEKILIAGPGFAKDNLKKFIGERDGELLKRIAFDSCSSAEKSGVYELLKRGAVEKVAGEQRAEKEFVLVEKLIAEIAKGGLVAYGKEEVAKALDYGAVDELLVVDELLRKDKRIEELLEKAEKTRVKTTIFSSENAPAGQLSGFGGIAALLRFRIS